MDSEDELFTFDNARRWVVATMMWVLFLTWLVALFVVIWLGRVLL